MKTTKIIILLIPILLFGFKYEKECNKRILPFEHLVFESELIVSGRISKVENGTYQFEIEKIVKGDEEICNEISIKKWMEWVCDRGRKKHKIGQQIILYLKNKNPETKSWQIINGSSGEWIIESDKYRMYYKSNILESIDLVEKYFVKVDKWSSKINCTSMELFKHRIENAFFDGVVTLWERSKRNK